VIDKSRQRNGRDEGKSGVSEGDDERDEVMEMEGDHSVC
jgi:hypothetical protein